MLPYFEREISPPLMISFSSFLRNWFHAARWTFWGEAFFWNSFGLISKVLGTYGQPSVLLSKNQSRCFKLQPTCPEKYSPENCFWKNKFRKSSWVKKFKFSPKLPQACQNSIQHNQKTNYWKKKTFLREFFCTFVFRLGGWNFVILVKNPGILSKRVPMNNPRKMFLWTRKQEKQDIERRFPGLSSKSVVDVVKFAI